MNKVGQGVCPAALLAIHIELHEVMREIDTGLTSQVAGPNSNEAHFGAETPAG